MPHKSSVPLFWRLKKSKYSLFGNRCVTCGSVFFPPRSFCPECRRRGNLVEHRLAGTGEVISYTKIHAPPVGFERLAPYVLAVIKLDEGPNITAPVVGDTEKIKKGSRVAPVFRQQHEDGKNGLIYYTIKFSLV